MKQEIPDKMDERRTTKMVDMDMEKYHKLHKEIRKMCKQVKEEWLNMQCDEIERNSLSKIHKNKKAVLSQR